MDVKILPIRPKFRVFRRNQKNIIILWDSEQLKEEQKNNISVELLSEDNRKLFFIPFVNQKPEKIKSTTQGILINQVENNLDPTKDYDIKIILGQKEIVVGYLEIRGIQKQNKANK